MARLLRHRRTKGPATDRPSLNHRATPRLYRNLGGTLDAGTGLQAGIAAVQQQRQQDGQPPLENGLDVFHTTQEARRVLRQIWSRVERLWEQAEAADRRVAQAQQQGHDARRGGRGALRLEEDGDGVPAVRTIRSGLEDRSRGPASVSSRGSVE